MRRLWALAVAALPVAACVLFPPLDDLGDGGALGDAGSDAPSFDVSAESLGFDGASDVALVEASFCQQVDATFCDDFDTDPLAVKWAGRYERGGAVADLDSYDAAPSLPNTLLAVAPSADASLDPFNRVAWVSQALTGTFVHFELSFWLLLEQVDTNPYGAVLPFMIRVYDTKQPGVHALTLYAYPQKSYLYEADVLADGGAQVRGFPNLFVTPTAGKPTQFTVTIDRAPDGGGAALTVLVDGTIQGHYTGASGTLPAFPLGPTVEWDLGVTYLYGSVTSWRVRYDNVTVRAW